MYEHNLTFAIKKDQEDPLKSFRNKFLIPTNIQGEELIYLCGNSLGLQPKNTSDYIQQELHDWAKYGVEGHTDAKHPWLPYHEFLTNSMAKVVGAKPSEVVIMNSLTTNLHLMMVSFYQPSKNKYKILIEQDAFPSDKYAMESQLKFHGHSEKEGLIQQSDPKELEKIILDVLSKNQDKVTQYKSGKVKLFGYFVGEVMKVTKGKANPNLVNDILKTKLK